MNETASQPPLDDRALVRLFDRVLSSITDFAYTFDLAGRFTFVNKPLLDLWGLTLEQAVGKDFFDLLYPDDLADRLQRQIRQVIATKQRLADETPYTSPTGATGYYQYIFSPVLAVDGSVEAVAGSTRDITDRKRAEQELRESEARYRALFESLDEGFCIVEVAFDSAGNATDYQFLETNPAFERHTGLHGATGRRMRDLAPNHEQYWFDAYGRVALTGEPVRFESEARALGDRWFDAYAFRVGGADSRKVGILFSDVTARNLAAQALRDARDAAEAANRAKDKFLAVLSHELRTPLSPVVMTIPAIEIDPDMPFKFREDLAMVRRNIDLEVKLIDDLLDLSRVTSGKLRLQVQPVSAHEVLRHAIHNSLGDTSGKRLLIREELDAAHDVLTADPARLQQVFWNLIRNAVKFTPEDGTVTVRTWNDDEEDDGGNPICVEVRDTGVGIPPDVLPHVFDAFEQGDARTTRQFGGLGLGLAIAKAVVEMHGGTISVTSPGRDRGAAFTVRLDTVAPRTAQQSRDRPPKARSDIRPVGARVLLVEDHPDTCRALARLLQQAGYFVKTANTVAAALRLATAEAFDVVVSDIGLPDATGYELMTQLRDRHGIRGIALSGYGMEDDMRKSRDAGFVDHVVKPVNVAQLDAVIRRVTTGAISDE